MIMIDLSSILISRAIARDWLPLVVRPSGRYNEDRFYNYDGGVQVLSNGSRTIAVVLPLQFPVRGFWSGPKKDFDLSEEVERYFKRLKRVLSRIKVSNIFFTGGGTIQIPEWFKKFCEENSIKIHILTDENIYEESVILED